MEPGDVIKDYYDALRDEEPLSPYFSDDGTTVKFGISESLWGGDAVSGGLTQQTETTTDWALESSRLTVDQHGDCAWFADSVVMSWTDTETGIRYEFDTRWSGTLVQNSDEWQFVGMHVSTAGDT